MGRLLVVGLCAIGAAAPVARAQMYEMGPSTLDGGGGVLLGPTYTLSGTVGQTDAGGTLDGASYSLSGGFWQSLDTAGCVADLAPPFGALDFTDILSFLGAFGAMEPEADLSAPSGVWDFTDVIAFLTAFGAGCP